MPKHRILYFYSDSCFHCKYISSDIDYLETKIPTARIKKGEHKDLHDHYNIEYYPSMFLINKEDEVINGWVGAKKIKKSIEKLKEIIKKSDNE
jgi:predicted AlkP superfamily phosphohydrolase/phosphomutase